MLETTVRKRRLRWFGHVQRMGDSRRAKYRVAQNGTIQRTKMVPFLGHPVGTALYCRLYLMIKETEIDYVVCITWQDIFTSDRWTRHGKMSASMHLTEKNKSGLSDVLVTVWTDVWGLSICLATSVTAWPDVYDARRINNVLFLLYSLLFCDENNAINATAE